MILPAATQRDIVRPAAAGPSMPALDVPHIALPDSDHRGTSLAKLADPPAPGSTGAERDMAVTRSLVAQRNAASNAWARALDEHGATVVWRDLAAGVRSDRASQALVQALVGKALAAASTQAGIGKSRWSRLRPFQVDPMIDLIGRTPKPADSSYPSGHSARAYAAARVIAHLDPSLEREAFAMAREVALSRVYAGAHFASDVVAGAKLGLALGASVIDRWRSGKLKGLVGDAVTLRAA